MGDFDRSARICLSKAFGLAEPGCEPRGSTSATPRRRLQLHQLPPTTELEARWPEYSFEQRRRIATAVIDCVFVSRGYLLLMIGWKLRP